MANRQIRPIRVEGNIAYVPLTRGYVAVISAADVPLVEGFNWTAAPDGRTVYAYRMVMRDDRKQRMLYMHRAVTRAQPGMLVDHIDGDGLNNTRANLRLVGHRENAMNKKTPATSQSGLKGATFNKRQGRWKSAIVTRGRQIYLGYFDTKEEAHAAYVKASAEIHGIFGRTS